MEAFKSKLLSFLTLIFSIFIITSPIVVYAMTPVQVTVPLEAAGEIEIKVTPLSDSPAYTTETVKFNKKDNLKFSFEKPGMYSYTVKAISKDTNSYKYDRDTTYHIDITVVRNEGTNTGETVLIISKEGETGKLDKIIFEMTPVKPEEETPKPSPTPVPPTTPGIFSINVVKTGYDSHFYAYAGLLVVSAAAIALIIMKKNE